MESTIADHKEQKNKRKGFITSFTIHIALLILALLPLLTFPDPPPGQEGILVNLGIPDVGQGNDNAPPTKSEEVPAINEPEPAPPEPEPVEVEPEPTPPEPEPVPEVVEEEAPAKEVVTDDRSKEIALEKEKEAKRKEAARKKRLEEERIKREKAEAERKKRAAEEAERKRKEDEARRKAAAEAEAKRKAAEEAARKKAEADRISSDIGGLFGDGKGKGNTGKPGNQGDPGGDPDSDVLEGISTGSGKVGGGLGSRGIVNSPKVTDNSQKTGRVVIKVCVGSTGSVVSAEFTQRGSTTTDSRLRQIAVANAKKYKFSRGGPEKQCGTITYDFKVR